MKSHTTTCVLTLMLAGSAFASHIPNHKDSDPIFPVPIPGQEFFNGGGSILFVTAIGPDAGSVISNTTFDITLNSDGTTPASDILIIVELIIDDVPVELEVTGSDLGFTSGRGIFRGTFSTDVFNGTVSPGLFPPSSIVNLTLGSIQGPLDGTAFYVDSFILFNIGESILGDLDNSGSVNGQDLLILLNAWGTADAAADLDDNGTVGGSDLLILLNNWG